MIDQQMFFTRVRHSLFGGKLGQGQVDGMVAIITAFIEAKGQDMRHLAYILATAHHECAKTFQPIEEYGKGKGRAYGKRLWYNGKGYTDIDTIFYGRGYTQNTWRDNYVNLTKAASKAGHDWDFEAHPELLLQPGPSAWATIYAMSSGLYTGKRLKDYINDHDCDWVGARRIINGADCAKTIASYAIAFYEAFPDF